jgi:methyltransferase-like protein
VDSGKQRSWQVQSRYAKMMVRCATTEEAVSVTNGAANVIPRNQLDAYIFISSPFL